ncbi:hypothetical protein MKW98_010572 [Papaver atlanticum]|uniref:RING-type E3 ubiquitin transferase n=1 Tax=Papaver atlanticum TaxID=357466 RepID=A0AAD4S451_9MAGN|nr:hypothetical protein MKW98_010572 [Papaver atlanticum]
MCVRKLSYLLFFLFFLTMITGQENRYPIKCSNSGNEPQISYPFRVKDRRGEGGYPGFDLTCNTLGETVLRLPQSGEFLVRNIDYVNKEIRLYDQDGCLARRFQQQNLNINLSPFEGFGFRTFNFANCPPSATSHPPDELAGMFLDVRCFNEDTKTIVFPVSPTSTSDSKISQVLTRLGCVIKAPITIPVPLDAVTDVYKYGFDDLYLTWVDPKKPPDSDRKGLIMLIIAVITVIIALIGFYIKMGKRCETHQF